MATAGSVPGVGSPARRAASVLPFVVVGVATVLIATRVTAPSIGVSVGIAVGIGVIVWMFFTESLERPLIVFMLYLGLLDGYLKLKTDSSALTLGRDVLLYALLLGFLARSVLRRQSLRLPPLSGWVLAFTMLAVVQVANPASHGILHTLGALRPHLEFVPLFFVGYYMLQTPARLRTFLLVLLVIATANGIVNIIQLNLTPAQLASWGPGYALRISGKGTGLNQVSGRSYTTATGSVRTRPFGLGDDAGVGAAWGMLALGGALALVSLGLRQRAGRISLLLCVGPPLAIISGEGRSLLIASIVALVCYVACATTARRLIPTMTALIFGIAVIVGVFLFIGSVSGSGVFDRYKTITPGKLTSTTSNQRGGSLADIPRLAAKHPLGNGLGSVGPAAEFAGGGNTGSNGETEPGFLLSELGIPGLLVIYGFNLNLLFLAATRIRRLEPGTRIYVAALLAGLVGLLVSGASGTTTATSPDSAYLWFAGGALSYWLTVGVRSPLTGPAGRRWSATNRQAIY